MAQLKKLRGGRGLTPERLEKQGDLMSCLGTSDPVEAHQALLRIIEEEPDTDPMRALRVDFGLALPELLDAEPGDREVRYLGDRRSSYASLIGRDVKTLARWSDKAAADVRARLLADTFTGHLYVIALVQDSRIVSCSLVREPLAQHGDEPVERISTDLTNPTDGPTPPVLLYAFPRDWRPAALTLAVTFLDAPAPKRAFGLSAESFVEVSFWNERYALRAAESSYVCNFVNPSRSNIYGIWWE